MIQVAPYGPEFLPGDSDDIPVTMAEQVQKAVDRWNAGATVLHVHVREADGKGQAPVDVQRDAGATAPRGTGDAAAGRRFDLLRPEGEGADAKWLNDDTRHMLAELTPKPTR